MRPARAIDGSMRPLATSLLLVLALEAPAAGQNLFGASPHQPPVADKTGTNPLNQQQQVDVINSYVQLGDLYLNTTTYRHLLALFNRRLSIGAAIPFAVTNVGRTRESGLGDVSASVRWTPWLFRKGGLVAGMTATWDTATNDFLGLGVHTVMPYGQFVLQPSARTLVAPFIAYRVGAGGDRFAPEVKDTLVGVETVWRTTPRLWVSAVPQVVLDAARDSTYGEVSGEVGFMLRRRLGTYVRPSVGYGRNGEKPYDWGLAAGVRFIP